MALRPQCIKLAVSYFKETSYGQAFNNTGIDKMFTLDTVPLLDVSQTREDDADALNKGYEFPHDTAQDIVTIQNAQLPLAFRGSLSCLGWLCSLITGTDNVVDSAPNYTHTFKIQDGCVSDQPPSTDVITALTADADSFYKLTGCCLNDAKIVIDKPGNVIISGTMYSDGKLTPAPTYAFPGSYADADTLRGIQVEFWSADYGQTLVDKSAKFMSAEFTLNNNLDLNDGRLCFADSNQYLSSLRFGNRAITFTVRVNGHQGDEWWQDWQYDSGQGKVKDIELKLTISALKSMSIRCKKVKIAQIKSSFNGIRDQNEITYKVFYEDADSSPFVVTIMNTVAAYLKPITPGM